MSNQTVDYQGSQNPWHVTVVRTHGLRLMRQEKKWRPIVRIEVDRHHSYETILGSDGQNVNMKETFCFENADHNSMLDVRIYCQSQTKKKGKRTKEVAAAVGYPLGQLIKKQESERKVELRLQCQTQNKKTNASRGKPQNGASVVLRIRYPPSYASSTVREDVQEEEDIPPAYTSGSESSDTLTMPPTPVDPTPPSPLPPPSEGLRRRRTKGYTIYSDEEPYSSGGEDGEPCQPMGFAQFAETDERDSPPQSIPPTPKHSTFTQAVNSIHTWIAASVLPQYTQQLTVPPASMNPAERAISAFTLYSELKEAGTESDYEPIFERLQREWQYVGGLLAALAAVNAAVFAISPDSLFQIHPYALSAIAGSSMASGLGTAIDAWFLFRYNWVDLKTFIFRARDVYGSYFFFALSARMPAMCMLLSALALMAFLGLVAFEVWPEGVAVVCFLVGLIMSLQFLVYGAHWCAGKIVAGGKASKKGVVMAVRKMTQGSTVEPSK